MCIDMMHDSHNLKQNIHQLADMTDGFTSADIKGLMREV
jgi:hypothetical protein